MNSRCFVCARVSVNVCLCPSLLLVVKGGKWDALTLHEKWANNEMSAERTARVHVSKGCRSLVGLIKDALSEDTCPALSDARRVFDMLHQVNVLIAIIGYLQLSCCSSYTD